MMKSTINKILAVLLILGVFRAKAQDLNMTFTDASRLMGKDQCPAEKVEEIPEGFDSAKYLKACINSEIVYRNCFEDTKKKTSYTSNKDVSVVNGSCKPLTEPNNGDEKRCCKLFENAIPANVNIEFMKNLGNQVKVKVGCQVKREKNLAYVSLKVNSSWLKLAEEFCDGLADSYSKEEFQIERSKKQCLEQKCFADFLKDKNCKADVNAKDDDKYKSCMKNASTCFFKKESRDGDALSAIEKLEHFGVVKSLLGPTIDFIEQKKSDIKEEAEICAAEKSVMNKCYRKAAKSILKTAVGALAGGHPILQHVIWEESASTLKDVKERADKDLKKGAEEVWNFFDKHLYSVIAEVIFMTLFSLIPGLGTCPVITFIMNWVVYYFVKFKVISPQNLDNIRYQVTAVKNVVVSSAKELISSFAGYTWEKAVAYWELYVQGLFKIKTLQANFEKENLEFCMNSYKKIWPYFMDCQIKKQEPCGHYDENDHGKDEEISKCFMKAETECWKKHFPDDLATKCSSTSCSNNYTKCMKSDKLLMDGSRGFSWGHKICIKLKEVQKCLKPGRRQLALVEPNSSLSERKK